MFLPARPHAISCQSITSHYNVDLEHARAYGEPCRKEAKNYENWAQVKIIGGQTFELFDLVAGYEWCKLVFVDVGG